MGYDSACTLTTGGRTYRGTARLEQKELVFRGETRLVIPLDRVTDVHARGPELALAFGDQRAVFDIGTEAGKWAKRIASPPSRIQKLGIKSGARVSVIAIEDDALAGEMAAQGAVLETSPRARELDAIFFGAERAADLDRLAALKARLAPAGALWVIRRKGKGAPVGEADSMAAGKRAGLVDVKVVSFSETHSAEKYVIPVATRGPGLRSASSPARARGSVSSRGRK